MELKQINNKETWENFLLKCREKTFLNSWNWGEFQKKQGNKIWRLGIYDQDQLIGIALAVKIEAKRGRFLFLPHSPIIKDQGLKFLIKELKEIAKQEKATFIRIGPIDQRNEENIRAFRDLGFKQAPIYVHPEVTWELDISPSEDDLLMAMRKTTRYLIRQAEKNKNIEIIKSLDIKDLVKFNQVYQETADRHHFTPFSLKCLENQFSAFSPDNQILILLGKYKNEIVSSAVIVFWQDMAFYHHGASLSKYRKIPVSYLLQWEAIKEAKKRGCRLYNFWGIAEQELKDKSSTIFQRTILEKQKTQKIVLDKNHPWWGLTLFKMGFGGQRKEYVKTQDLVLSLKYYPTCIFEKIRRTKRGL